MWRLVMSWGVQAGLSVRLCLKVDECFRYVGETRRIASRSCTEVCICKACSTGIYRAGFARHVLNVVGPERSDEDTEMKYKITKLVHNCLCCQIYTPQTELRLNLSYIQGSNNTRNIHSTHSSPVGSQGMCQLHLY